MSFIVKPPEPKRDNSYSALAPNLAAAIGLVITHANQDFAAGRLKFRLGMFEGRRSPARQHWLWQSGRVYQGPWLTNVDDISKGWHGFGLAIDCAWLTSSGEWTWEVSEGHWIRYEQLCNKFGLVTGRLWKRTDAPHAQPANLKTTPSPEAARLYAMGGVEAVWKATGHDRVHVFDTVCP